MQPARPTVRPLLASILVGVEERGLSDSAVHLGLELGRRLGSPVDLVHAVATAPDFWPGIDLAHGARLKAEFFPRRQAELDARLRSLRLDPRLGAGGGGTDPAIVLPEKGHVVRLVEGHPARVLLAEARARGAGLIVLGAHEEREFVDIGGTLRAVFAHAKTPVWLQRRPVGPIETILAPVDLSEESLAALSLACSLAKILRAQVHAVECFHPVTTVFAGGLDLTIASGKFPFQESRQARIAAFERTMGDFDWQGVSRTFQFVDGEPVAKILEFSRSADLVALGTHGRTGLASTFLGGVAYSIFRLSEKPVLAVRHAERAFLI